MEIKGKVTEILPEQSGQGKNGTWRKRDFILETGSQYPKKVCITQWGERIDQNPVGEGDEVTCHIDVESREFNGRWYTDVKAWKVEKENSGDQIPGNFQTPPPPSRDDFDGVDNDKEDLPF